MGSLLKFAAYGTRMLAAAGLASGIRLADGVRVVAGEAARTLADAGPERGRRQVWVDGDHATIEVRGGRSQAVADAARRAVSALQGVRWTRMNVATGQLLIAFDSGRVNVSELLKAVRGIEAASGTGDDEFPWSLPEHPANGTALSVTYAALAGDLISFGAGLASRAGWLPPLHSAVRVPLAVIDGYPRLRRRVESRIGPAAADMLLGIGNAVLYGISEGPARPVVDAAYRVMMAGELRARMEIWAASGPDLVEAANGESRPAARPPLERPCPYPDGPVERYVSRVAVGTLPVAAGVLAATRDAGRASEAINAALPTARRGREGFAAMLGRGLARRGVIPLDRFALRRLDRISAVVIDAAVLVSGQPRVLSASADEAERDAALWQAASEALQGTRAEDMAGPGPWRSGGHQLIRTTPPGETAGPDDPAGLRLEVRGPDGRRIGEVTVGCEPDGLAEAVLSAGRRGASRLLVTRHASLAELTGLADDVTDGDLTERVRSLQKEGEGVLLVSADASALAVADVAACCLKRTDGLRVSMNADLICGPDLADVWRLLRAIAPARKVSERSATLAGAGAALGVLRTMVRPDRRGRRRGRRGGSAGWADEALGNPVQAAALGSLLTGAQVARGLDHEEPPAPVTRTAWHAMSPADVLSRLDQACQRPGQEETAADSRRDPPGKAAPALAPAIPRPREAAELAQAVLAEMRDPLTPLLLTGSAASAMLGSAVDAGLVGAVMAGNAVIGGVQRLRTERALHALMLRERHQARRVRRSPGEQVTGSADEAIADLVPAAELRPGDVIALHDGDVVPADARLLSVDALEVDESTLTGESVPVSKDPAATVAPYIADRTSMVYEGTTVVSGSAVAVVVATGEATEAGRSAAAAAASQGRDPGADGEVGAGMSARLGQLTSAALPATTASGLTVAALGMLRGTPLREALSAGVAVAVAAVPEGLPLVSTVAELGAARRLSGRGVLVRSPRTLEALGRVDMICFDKTGTLTEGRLRVVGAAEPGGDLDPGSERARQLLRIAARACPQPGSGRRVTHATDQAILDAAAPLGDDAWRLVSELPFENNRGYSASLGMDGETPVLAVKGAPEVLLDRCSQVAMEGSEPVPFTAHHRERAEETTRELAARGLRLLAVAERVSPAGDQPAGEAAEVEPLVHDLTLVGFVTIADVMRPEAADVVRRLTTMGVRPVMITGDHPETARAIARQAAIPDAGQVVTGAELDGLPERERRDQVSRRSVFARITPEQKLRIVTDLRRAGRVVVMVGDGANDAAAIRVADVGIGVSARGSTAARTSSDLVLTEAGIEQIPQAVREGRALWESVRDAVSILVGGNAGEIAFIVLGSALTGRSPLNTRQLLLVNMLTDMFPALAVAGTEPTRGDPGQAPAATVVLTGPLGKAIAIRGGATALGATLAWAGGRLTGRPARAATMGLAAVVTTQLAQTVAAGGRSPAVLVTSVASAAALAAVINTPGVSQFFGCTPLGPAAWGIVAASSVAAAAVGVVITARSSARDVREPAAPGQDEQDGPRSGDEQDGPRSGDEQDRPRSGPAEGRKR
jgi:cation-transporting P-type ATPase I